MPFVGLDLENQVDYPKWNKHSVVHFVGQRCQGERNVLRPALRHGRLSLERKVMPSELSLHPPFISNYAYLSDISSSVHTNISQDVHEGFKCRAFQH